MKICTVCKEEKEFSEFYNFRGGKDGKQSRCKLCDNAASKKYKNTNYDRFLFNSRKRQLKYKYGLTPEDYDVLLAKQNNSCGICGLDVSLNKGPGPRNGSKRFCVDHDHKTGRIRGLLCNDCNRGLGLFGDDGTKIRKAIEYLGD
jgi:hypothetical protein